MFRSPSSTSRVSGRQNLAPGRGSLVLETRHELPKGLTQVNGGARRAQSQAGFLSNWPLEDVVYSEDSRFKDRLGRKKARKGSPWDHLSLGELARWLLRECWARPLGGKRVPGLPETSLVAVSKPVQGDRKGGRRGPFPLTHFSRAGTWKSRRRGRGV